MTFQTPFLRVQRLFPQEAQPLSVEVDRAYTDTANAMNARTLGLYTKNDSIQNGETWHQDGLKYQGFRQFYTFTGAGSIPHGIDTTTIFAFTQIYGTFKDTATPANWYPLPYVDVTTANNQINLYVTSANIVIATGSATPPTISSGLVVLEWIVQS